MRIQYRLNMALNPPPGGVAVRKCDRPDEWPTCQKQTTSCEGIKNDRCCLAFFVGQDAFKKAEAYLKEINPGGKMARGAGQDAAAKTFAAIKERWEKE